MAVLGDERLFALLEADGEAIAQRRRRRRSRAARSPRSSSGRLGQGRGRHRRRARARRADHAEPRPLARPRARGRGRVRGSPARRGRRIRPARRPPGSGVRSASRRPTRATRIEGAAHGLGLGVGRAPLSHRAVCWEPLATDKKHAGGPACAGCCRRTAGVTVRTDVPGELVDEVARRPVRRRRGDCGRRTDEVREVDGHDARARAPGPEPEPARHARAGDLRARDARRDPRRAGGHGPAGSASSSTTFQSNHEGALIDRLHRRDFDVAIVNAAGLTHTSVALRDALLGIERPFVEVHLSDPSTREPFRHVNFLHRHRDRARSSDRGRAATTWRSKRSPDASEVRMADGGHGSIRRVAELRRAAARIDALDREIVRAPERAARAGREVGREKALLGSRAVHDPEREREVLLRRVDGERGADPPGGPARDLPAAHRATRPFEDRGLGMRAASRASSDRTARPRRRAARRSRRRGSS